MNKPLPWENATLYGYLYRLKTENTRLQAEVERLRASSFVTAVPSEEYEKLKAEVERLRKAGDEMAKRTEFFQKRWDADELCQEVEAWLAAKEGKPSE